MCCLLWCYEGMRVFVKYVLRVWVVFARLYALTVLFTRCFVVIICKCGVGIHCTKCVLNGSALFWKYIDTLSCMLALLLFSIMPCIAAILCSCCHCSVRLFAAVSVFFLYTNALDVVYFVFAILFLISRVIWYWQRDIITIQFMSFLRSFYVLCCECRKHIGCWNYLIKSVTLTLRDSFFLLCIVHCEIWNPCNVCSIPGQRTFRFAPRTDSRTVTHFKSNMYSCVARTYCTKACQVRNICKQPRIYDMSLFDFLV